MAHGSEEMAQSANASSTGSAESLPPARRWQPLGPVERRVLGVLVEKAKTTPEVYPLSLNAVTTGANQKNNRDPVMQLQPEEVESALERLRALGAVGLVEGYGRVPKYRHYLYDWLGVEKVEAAVMAELFLRGPQTEGQLRAHTSRMEPIPDLPTLRQILASLKAKGLVVSLTPEGRGHVVAHNLYPPREMQSLQAEYQQTFQPIHPQTQEGDSAEMASLLPQVHASSDAGREPQAVSASCPPATPSLEAQLLELRSQLALLRQQLESLSQKTQQHEDTLAWLRKELGF